jgi:AraC family transcriptional regulator
MLSKPVIKIVEDKLLAGHKLTMSFADNQTFRLWNTFMPVRKEIKNTVGNDLYNIQLYPENYFTFFNPSALFEKWAAVEVTACDELPAGIKPFELKGGMYAVFKYKGTGEDAPQVYTFILMEWLPQSGYVLDSRPHFEIMGDKYKRGHPDSEEEIWIPVKPI